MRRLAACLLMAACARGAPAFEDRPAPAGAWYKGNTHTHTSLSDGDSEPRAVVRWYKEHGYAFLAVTDHDRVLPPSALEAPGLVLLPGVEVTSTLEGRIPVHVNGLGVRTAPEPAREGGTRAALQANVDAVTRAGGVAAVNHPNFHWALGLSDLSAATGYSLLEIFSGQPDTNHLGGGGRPSAEALWDGLLTRGRRVYGLAVDDAHHFKGEPSPSRASPGRGWVVVRATAPTAEALTSALARGDFYASTGVELSDVRAQGRTMTVAIQPWGDRAYTTEFIGAGGVLLASTGDNPAVYRTSGREGYVRARVRSSQGELAWVQPRFLARP